MVPPTIKRGLPILNDPIKIVPPAFFLDSSRSCQVDNASIMFFLGESPVGGADFSCNLLLVPLHPWSLQCDVFPGSTSFPLFSWHSHIQMFNLCSCLYQRLPWTGLPRSPLFCNHTLRHYLALWFCRGLEFYVFSYWLPTETLKRRK